MKAHEAAEYHAWRMMLYRCRNPTGKDWPHYGGRGITVCERWNSYENFLSDMGRKPLQSLTLERIDNDKGYYPGNCCWETRKHQSKNRGKFKPRSRVGPYSKTKDLWGLPFTIQEMCDIVGIKLSTYKFRVRYGGMSPAQALLVPVRSKQNKGQ